MRNDSWVNFPLHFLWSNVSMFPYSLCRSHCPSNWTCSLPSDGGIPSEVHFAEHLLSNWTDLVYIFHSYTTKFGLTINIKLHVCCKVALLRQLCFDLVCELGSWFEELTCLWWSPEQICLTDRKKYFLYFVFFIQQNIRTKSHRSFWHRLCRFPCLIPAVQSFFVLTEGESLEVIERTKRHGMSMLNVC